MIDEKGNPVSVKTYPYIGGSFDYIHFKGDDSWWVKERTCRDDGNGCCSNCGSPAPQMFARAFAESPKYCPECGAVVVGE